jgi:hypothetical protein
MNELTRWPTPRFCYMQGAGDGLTVVSAMRHSNPKAGSIRSRTWHALASTLICRGDNGKNQPNYSHVLGSLVAGAVANAHHPESSRGAGLTLETPGITHRRKRRRKPCPRVRPARTGAIRPTFRKRQALASGKVVRVRVPGKLRMHGGSEGRNQTQYQAPCAVGRRRRNSYPCVTVLREDFSRLANR